LVLALDELNEPVLVTLLFDFFEQFLQFLFSTDNGVAAWLDLIFENSEKIVTQQRDGWCTNERVDGKRREPYPSNA
jgi:hypothetical protein